MAQKMCVLKNTPLIFVRATRLGTFLKSCGVSSQSCCRRMNIFPARRRAGGQTGREMSSDNGFGHGQAARVHACLSSCLAACLCQVCARARVHVR